MLDRFVPPQAKDAALLIARIGIGIVFLAHGVQKFGDGGIGGTITGFTKMGVPAPALSAVYATVVEIAGGVLLILGALMPLVGILLFLDMAGAFLFVHAGSGLFVENGGFELVLILGVASLVFAAAGSGKYGVDALFARRGAQKVPADA